MSSDAPKIRAIRPETDRSLAITWKGGAQSVVDVSDHLADYVVFARLRTDDDLFRGVRVGEWGWCAHWTDDIEISADTLWRLALKQGAAWLGAWRRAHGMAETEAAKALGVSTRLWREYEAGTRPLPKTVRLAAVGFDAQARAA